MLKDGINVPSKLYKYCPVSLNSLSSALNAKVYHSLPTAFNDPLDCNPSIIVNSPIHHLISLLEKMMLDDGCTVSDFQDEINKIYYFSTSVELFDDTTEYEAALSQNLSIEIRRRIKREYAKRGVLSLTEDWDNPLLWSHYAAQHEGICIEYDTGGHDPALIRSINYNAPRSIYTNDVYSWKRESSLASEQKVYDTYFLAKAPQWGYEKEWRLISEKAGLRPTKLNMTAIYFGMKNSPVWQWMLSKTLNRDQDIKLYEVFADEDTFELKRREVERTELESRGINRPAFSAFENFMTADEIAEMTVGERAVKNVNLKA